MIFLIIIIIVCHYHLISLSFVIIIIYQFHQISMLTFCICRCTGDPAFLLGGIWPKITFMPLVSKRYAFCTLKQPYLCKSGGKYICLTVLSRPKHSQLCQRWVD